jgi:hypothetical protein
MQPLDRDNAEFRRDAAAMRTATLQQRAGNDEQRARMLALRDANHALRKRARLEGAPRARAWTGD